MRPLSGTYTATMLLYYTISIVIAAMDVLRLGERFLSLVIGQTSTPFPWPNCQLFCSPSRVLPIFIDGNDQVDKRLPRPSVTIMWFYLVAMNTLWRLDRSCSSHAQTDASASASLPIAYGTADRAVQCAIPIPGAWGSKKPEVAMICLSLTIGDSSEYGGIRST